MVSTAHTEHFRHGGDIVCPKSVKSNDISIGVLQNIRDMLITLAVSSAWLKWML